MNHDETTNLRAEAIQAFAQVRARLTRLEQRLAQFEQERYERQVETLFAGIGPRRPATPTERDHF